MKLRGRNEGHLDVNSRSSEKQPEAPGRLGGLWTGSGVTSNLLKFFRKYLCVSAFLKGEFYWMESYDPNQELPWWQRSRIPPASSYYSKSQGGDAVASDLDPKSSKALILFLSLLELLPSLLRMQPNCQLSLIRIVTGKKNHRKMDSVHFLKIKVYLLLEREERGGRETSFSCLFHAPDPDIEPVIIWFGGRGSIH